MFVEQSSLIENIGKKAGYVVHYFLFTTILFFLLTLLHKIPPSWSYGHIMIITILIISIGNVLKRVL